ncbi:hypothetical protein CcaverHIS002_0211700 [Cutaneotrichosporon cavernicola]|uniref:Calpain catalytic domain-containing protein n=1 Tax=Cutaneotrichosporon cavernicola TaxID=279322 RepID=A0AA48IIR5_9TREE|nr:uncharacterized protein CcaverHIS019_0211700 [Cutaneotrichosporon cavernicola]BEI82010.1 hypothetical protein CcaverHIS002_0211700 [Cutaneotrichosporon cavernicola]BEI89808.1 hypothetical protein CcaverHIS019_0211700 [Cutaneotrichosporon cavernicola]
MKIALFAVLVGLVAAAPAPAIPNGDGKSDLVARNNWGGSKDDGWKADDDGHDGWKGGDDGHDGWKGGDDGHDGWKGDDHGHDGWKGDDHGHDGWKGDDHGHDGWKGDDHGHDEWKGGDDKGGDKGHGGGKNCLARRNGSPGMGSFYSKGWDNGDDKWDKHGDGKGHDDGHGGGHDGGHGGGHGGDDCPDPYSEEDTTKWILNNPSVLVNVVLPLRDIEIPIIEILDEGIVPIINRTAPVLDLNERPALLNGSSPATIWGGITSPGMNATFRPVQGTNKNADVFASSSPDSAFPQRKRQVAINSQPDLLPAGMCTYQYQHVLGGDGSASRGALWALEGYVDLVAADVQQGGIGDCGMGAAIMSLASGGWTRYIKNSFVRVGEGEGSYEVLLKKDGVTQRIAIDDQLPVLTNANPMCWPYPGFQPVLDAAFPGPDGTYPPTPIFFMPLFEKAFAKFLDANPAWKSAKPEETGYAGLEGVNPAYVLAAVTGGTPKSVWRTRPGFDGPILSALLTCMRGTAPCAISTGNSTTLEGLGMLDTTGTIWLNPGGDAAMPRGYTAGDTSGMLASDAPGSKSTFTVIDFDQVKPTPDGDRSTVLTFVGNHAYGFDHTRSTDFPLPASIDSLIDVRMAALNPWGSNPCQWPGGGCGTGGLFSEPSELPFSFRTLAMSIVGVFTVENMPVSV